MRETNVSVIGLGLMGNAIARCLVDANYPVTVWNRSKDKVQDFLSQSSSSNKVSIAPSILCAVQNSTVIIICIRDYDASDALLRHPDIEPHLANKTLIQLSTGTPARAQEAASWASRTNTHYLDGEIMAFPKAIGSQNCPILYAGESEVYDSCKAIINTLGEPAQWVDANTGAAAALGNAGLSVYFGFLFGVLNGAAICKAEGIPLIKLQALTSSLSPFLDDVLTRSIQMIDKDDYQSTHSTLETSAGALNQIAEIVKNANLDERFIKCLQGYAEEGIKEGKGAVSNAVLFEAFCDHTNTSNTPDK